MHRAILLAIGMEPDDAVLAEELRHFARELVLLGIEPSQDAFEADIDRDVPDLAFRLRQYLARRRNRIARPRCGEHHALVDGAEEAQRPVFVDLLDRARVVGPADP